MSEKLDISAFEEALEKSGLALHDLRICVAVSGGGDSMALTLLLKETIAKHGGEMLCLTVDHGLRSNSAEEAEWVHKQIDKLGIRHKTLRWEGDKPQSGIEEKAREARYRLLINECKAEGFEYLAVAHNVEDLAETFWIRLIHASGLDGLASIAQRTAINGITIIRPLLQFNRANLRDYCLAHKIEWVDDPMNQDDKFQRVKLRKFEEMLESEGLSSKRLAKTISKLEDARESIDYFIRREAGEILEINLLGYIKIDSCKWSKLPPDAVRRILDMAINYVYPQLYSTGYDLLEATRVEIIDKDKFNGKALKGCEIFPDRDGNLIVARESARIPEFAIAQHNDIWDMRFKTSLLPEGLQITPLSDEDLSILKKDEKIQRLLSSLPYKIKRGLPAIKNSGKLLAVPHVGYYCPSCPENAKNVKIDFIAMERPFK